MTLAQMIESGTREMNISLPLDAAEKFGMYRLFLEERAKTLNLTSLKDEKSIAELHFLDSLSLLAIADFRKARVIDIGSGAGFPGLPLKIAEPTIDLALLDARYKRVEFLSDLCSQLDIEACCIHGRAEEFAHQEELRERFDIVVSRAVAQLNILCELCLPFVCPGGLFLAMKSLDSADELRAAQGAIETLGAKHENSIDYAIPGTGITHRAILIRKTSETPKLYPRRYSKIRKSPIASI